MGGDLGTVATKHFDCTVDLTNSKLDAQQLTGFADTQMPRSGIGEVPWSTPISAEDLAGLAAQGNAEFVTARMQIMGGELSRDQSLVGIGALIRDPKRFEHPRMIIVVETDSRKEGIGTRLANEILERLNSGETVEVEVQTGAANRGPEKFFERLGFEIVNPSYRSAKVPEYSGGHKIGDVDATFALYSYTKSDDAPVMPKIN